MTTLLPGLRRGTVVAPPSKSHAHRLVIADFLAGDRTRLADDPSDSADIVATKRCLRALAEPTETPTLDCGESGSTLRFLAPVAAALGKRPVFVKRGRLAARPAIEYPTLAAGRHELSGGVSSQFVTGLLFALPLLKDNSEIRFTSPLESRGYVDLTLQVLEGAGVRIEETKDGFLIPGGQRYRAQPGVAVEGDWSGAAFWLAMNALGSAVTVTGLNDASRQPDRAIVDILARLAEADAQTVDVSPCPDIFPELAIVAARRPSPTTFVGIRRLRIKECDRVAAMADVLARFGVDVMVTEESFVVPAVTHPFRGHSFTAYADHRIAMAIAVGATVAEGPVVIDDIACADKSYPGFFQLWNCTAARAV